MEQCVVFPCAGEELVAILHLPESQLRRVGVLIVVGGPQYRVGSHRQFVLMARALANEGYSVLRFDYRGLGDSSGPQQDFTKVGEDVIAAVDMFFKVSPGLSKVAVFGLCDAASAALMFATRDARIGALILANPWVRTAQGKAYAIVAQYYPRRILALSTWSRLFKGEINLVRALRDLWSTLKASAYQGEAAVDDRGDFIGRMLAGLRRFEGPVLVLTSDDDLTAKEFNLLVQNSVGWHAAIQRSGVVRGQIPNADHTFSTRESLVIANGAIIRWLGQIETSMTVPISPHSGNAAR